MTELSRYPPGGGGQGEDRGRAGGRGGGGGGSREKVQHEWSVFELYNV